MHIALALILIGHGFAHLVGFVVPWRIATLKEMPYKTTILADSVNVGDKGIRVMGILWLMAALAFAVLARLPWWQWVTLVIAVFSFFRCILGWPDSRIGVFASLTNDFVLWFVNVAIVAFLLVAQGWDLNIIV